MLPEQECTALRKSGFLVALGVGHGGIAVQHIGKGVGADLSPEYLLAEYLL